MTQCLTLIEFSFGEVPMQRQFVLLSILEKCRLSRFEPQFSEDVCMVSKIMFSKLLVLFLLLNYLFRKCYASVRLLRDGIFRRTLSSSVSVTLGIHVLGLLGITRQEHGSERGK